MRDKKLQPMASGTSDDFSSFIVQSNGFASSIRRKHISNSFPAPIPELNQELRMSSMCCIRDPETAANMPLERGSPTGPNFSSHEVLRKCIKQEAWGHHASSSNNTDRADDPMAVVD